MARPVLRSGAHPSAADLHKMRLGYEGYDTRLEAIKQRNPARYAAIMAGAKHFTDPAWICNECQCSERSTRNLACRVCSSARARRVFVHDNTAGLLVYRAENPDRSENWQQRHQASLYLADAEARLRKLPGQRAGRFRFEDCRVWSADAVVLDVPALMQCCDALHSGDAVRIRECVLPLIEHDKALAVLVRSIAGALLSTTKPRPA